MSNSKSSLIRFLSTANHVRPFFLFFMLLYFVLFPRGFIFFPLGFILFNLGWHIFVCNEYFKFLKIYLSETPHFVNFDLCAHYNYGLRGCLKTCSVTSKVWASQVIAPAGSLVSAPERLLEHPSSVKYYYIVRNDLHLIKPCFVNERKLVRKNGI